jgi:general secretion pathway protein L
MTSLRLLIDAAWPHEHTDCVWYLCDNAGQVLQHGRSEPRHWPGVGQRDERGRGEAQACDLVLTGGQAACFQVALPKGAAGRRPEVVGAALEEHLLDDAANCQFLIPDQLDSAGRSTVAAIAGSRLAALAKITADLGLAARSVWPDGLLLKHTGAHRQGRAAGGQMVLPTPGGSFATFDFAALAACLPRMAEFGVNLPLTLAVEGELAQLAALSEASGLFELHKESEAVFPFRPPPPGGFLQGKFAPPRQRFAASRHFIPALKLLAGITFFASLLVVAEWGWFSLQARQHRAEVEQLYRQAIPQGPLVDPVLQMQRQIDARRRLAGKLGNGDFLQLLAGFSAAGDAGNSPVIAQMDYDGGRLQLGVSIPVSELDRWLSHLRQQGLRSEIVRREERDGQAIVSLVLTDGGVR